jgi:hypothetical protein
MYYYFKRPNPSDGWYGMVRVKCHLTDATFHLTARRIQAVPAIYLLLLLRRQDMLIIDSNW